MIDYVGRFDTLDKSREFNRYRAEQEEAAMNAWMAENTRNRTNEANIRNRALSESRANRYNQQAGLFGSMDEDMANLRPQNLTPQGPTNATGTVGTSASPSATQEDTRRFMEIWNRGHPAGQPPIVDQTLDLQAPIEQRQYTRQELRENPQLARRIQDAADRGEVVIGNLAGGNIMVYPMEGSAPNQPHLGPLYFPRPAPGNESDVGGGFGFGVDPRFTAEYFGPSEGAPGFRPINRPQVTIDTSEDPTAAVRSYNQSAAAPQTAMAEPTAAAQGTSLAGRAQEVAEFLRSQGIHVDPQGVVRDTNTTSGQHDMANAIDSRGSSDADAQRVQAMIEQQYPGARVRSQFIPDGTRFPNGVVAHGDHVHTNLNVGGSTSGRTQSANVLGEPQASRSIENDTHFQQIRDVTRSTGPTPEMELAYAQVQNHLADAELLAQYGDPAGAEVAFTSAIQGQAAYRAAGRSVLYRAALGGNNEAAAYLIAQASGYEPGTVRIRPTDERRPRFALEVLNDDGTTWMPATEAPVSREEMYGQLQGLVDAQGAAERRAASQHLQEALIEANVDLQIADLEHQDRVLAQRTQAAIAQLGARERAMIAQGRATLLTDSENGGMYITYPEYDEDGNVYHYIGRIGMEEQNVPDTNGRDTENVPVLRSAQRVTGTPRTRPAQ